MTEEEKSQLISFTIHIQPDRHEGFIQAINKRGLHFHTDVLFYRNPYGVTVAVADESCAGMIGEDFNEVNGTLYKVREDATYYRIRFFERFRSYLNLGEPFDLEFKETAHDVICSIFQKDTQITSFIVEPNRNMSKHMHSLFQFVSQNSYDVFAEQFKFKVPCSLRKSCLYIERNPGDPVKYAVVPEGLDNFFSDSIRKKFKIGELKCFYYGEHEKNEEPKRLTFDGHLLAQFGATKGSLVFILKSPTLENTYYAVVKREDGYAVIIQRHIINALYKKIFYPEEESDVCV